MKPISELVTNLHNLDVKLWADDNTLRYNAPKETLTPALLNQMRERKAEILAFLQQNNTAANPNLTSILPVIRDRELPLSFAQQRLWFLEQLESGKSIYCIAAVYRLTGLLNVPALEQSLKELVQRHEILRTTFSSVDGQPVQLICPETTLTLPLINLQELPLNQREAEAKRQANQEAQCPFDLAQGPLFRTKLLRLTEQEHILLLNMHHIISDGWSFDVSFRELAALYKGFASNQPSPLPKLPIQYADFAAWQRDWLQGDILKSQLDYWKQQLSGELPVLQLPTDHPRPPVKTYQGAHQSLELSNELTQALKALSQQQGVTLFMTLLAVFQTLLFRYSGQSDIIVGTPITGRNQVEVEALIGFFVNTLALRTDLSGNPSFRELLDRVRKVALGAYTHQDLPFEKLLEELQPERDQSRTPLFQVIFVLQKASRQILELPGLTLTPLEVHTGTAKFDLTLEFQETTEGMRGRFEYNTDLFDSATIVRMAGHFRTLLEGIIADPEQLLSNLPLLTAKEQHQLLVDWNDTQVDYPKDKCIHQLFEAQVELTPDAVAVDFEHEQLTYRELNYRANQLAHYLQKLGVKPEVLVGICMERSPLMIVGLLGILKAGGAYVPLDPAYPQERLAFMLDDAQVLVLLTQKSLVEMPKHQANIICLDTDWEIIKQENKDNPASTTTSNNLAYVIYTSGSTGKPKGVTIPHRAVNRLIFNTNYIHLKPNDRIAQASNTSFDAATFEIWGALLHGARLVEIPYSVILSPQHFASQLGEKEINVLFLTTALFNQLASVVPQAFKGLRSLLFGGEAVDLKWVKEILKHGSPEQLLHVYGPTESTTFTSWYLVQEIAEEATTLPIGRAIANTQIYILDNHYQPVPIGVIGELYIGGDGLARGYLNRPDLTEQNFISSCFSDRPTTRLYKTGDLARYLPDGNIEFIGRLDNQVKIRGFRIETEEIEAVLAKHPSVQQTAITVREDEPGERRLVAYVIPHLEQSLSTKELHCFLKQKLPDYMVPNTFVFLNALPLNLNGKVDRHVLPVPEYVRQELEDTFLAAQDELEVQLTKIWEQVLGIQPIGIKHNFFDLGGHSLLAMRLFAHIEKTFDKNLPIATLFQAPTIEQLASILRQTGWSASWSSLVPIQPNGSKLPLFLVAPGATTALQFADLARTLGSEQPVYGLQPQGLEKGQVPHKQIEEIASHYIKEIQTVQFEGPYLLGGRCSIGSVVAFEMAQQLQAQGQKVNLLLLIDPWHRDTFRNFFPQPQNSLSYYLNRLIYHWQHKQLIGTLIGITGLHKIADKFAYRFKPTHIQRIKALFDAHYMALGKYMPQVYPGQLTIFLCEERREFLPDYQNWQELAAEGVDLYICPGNHVTMLEEPNIEIAAMKLQTCLAACQSQA
ncbi:non-ribosomal peptide synthetase [Nostoc minutum NIES-26]|uniref:Non-ribosomal peptide synthetase n=1 Tax=Nostoc minutum NIES-26 TaxID=1844469 RepID=A0A367RW49_9NOSO|nr:non-ribosomal peptide synthetase [Nostoc minutum NIES-26]